MLATPPWDVIAWIYIPQIADLLPIIAVMQALYMNNPRDHRSLHLVST